MTWRGVAWRGVAWRGVAWRGVAWCGVAWYEVTLCDVMWREKVTITDKSQLLIEAIVGAVQLQVDCFPKVLDPVPT